MAEETGFATTRPGPSAKNPSEAGALPTCGACPGARRRPVSGHEFGLDLILDGRERTAY